MMPRPESRRSRARDTLRYGSAPERRARLLSMVVEQGFSTTAELVAALGVSDMTVRRDAQRLADEGRVRMVHGGVSVLPQSELMGSGEYEDRATRMASTKLALGRAAAALVGEGEVVIVDAGTTAREVARALPEVQLTVITHSAPVVADLLMRPSMSLISLGGQLHRDTLSFDGPHVSAAIEQLQADTFFLTASGIGSRGVFCANDFDAVTKRAMIAIAARVVLVVDSSKFGASAMVQVCRFADVDTVVVDDALGDEGRAMLDGIPSTVQMVATG